MPTEYERRQIWDRTTEPINNSDLYAMDCFGNEIHYYDYKRNDSKFGWKLKRITPQSLGGGNNISNFKAVHLSVTASLGGILGAFIDN